MKAIKILMLQTDTGLSGGICGYVSTLVKSEALKAFQLYVAAAGGQNDPTRAERLYRGATIINIPASYNFFGFFSYLINLREIIKRYDVDLVHAHAVRSALPAAMVARCLGIPMIYTNHGLRYTQKTGSLGQGIFWFLEWLVCRLAPVVVVLRDLDARRLSHDRIAEQKKVSIIETKIDFPAAEKSVATLPGVPLLIGVGSLIPVKRPDLFLDWIEALRKAGCRCRAAWVGDGPLRASLEATASQRGLEIEWLGQLSHAEMVDIYRNASLLLLTSDFEVLPLAVLEAYACGVPVIARRFDGVEAFVFADCTGEIIDDDDEDRVARVVVSLLGDQCRLQRMSTAASDKFVRSFSGAEDMATAYARIYAELTERSG